jgi:competence ComEA-like helix-hairpin-helix protein
MMLRSFAILTTLILYLGFGAAASAKKKPPERPVNLNTASSEELQLGPGIGPATADKILKMRRSYGPFKSVDDLLAIRGLGPKRLEKMRKFLTVGKPAATKPATSPVKSPPAAEKQSDNP